MSPYECDADVEGAADTAVTDRLAINYMAPTGN